MLNIAKVLRKKIRPVPTPTARSFRLDVPELKLHGRPPRFEAAPAMPNPDLMWKPEPGPNLQLKPVKSVKPDPDVPARRYFSSPLYRAGDGENAIRVCLQPYAVITLEDGTPPILKVLDPGTTPPESCCKLPGLRSENTNFHAQICLEISLNNTLPLHQVPPVLLETFWNNLPEAMTQEGKTMFAHFNAGMLAPATATDCYLRLQAYVKWLWRLAD